MKYIPEIDGLRAIAVSAVILYHLDIASIPGGFLGVDVFFVISGYLITQILLKESPVSTKQYFSDFYLRRSRRIFPALFTVVLVTQLMAVLVMYPADLLEVGRSSLASLAFVSNIYFYFNTGYFDAPAETMPLLHTWSLAVEEQFYLFWPAIVLGFLYRHRAVGVSIVVILLVVSIISSIIVTESNPSLAFYGFPFRAFEFMFGALIAVLPLRQKTSSWIPSLTLQIVGLILIGYSLFFITTKDPIPGYLVAIPSLGSAIYIFGVAKLTSPRLNPMKSRVALAIGKTSYSLYLWHWPVITLFKIYLGGDELTNSHKLYLLVVTVLLSTASYHCIEKPLRKSNWQSMSMAFSMISMSVIVAVSVFFIQTKGLENRVPNLAQYSSIEEMWRWNGCAGRVRAGNFDRNFCYLGQHWSSASKKIVLWGDSHASQVSPLLSEIADQYSLSILVIDESCKPATDGTRALLRHKIPIRATKGCMEEINRIEKLLESDSNVSLVILTGYWYETPHMLYSPEDSSPSFSQRTELMKIGLGTTIERLRETGVDVLLLGGIPTPQKTRQDCHSRNNLLRSAKPDCSPLPIDYVKSLHATTENVLAQLANNYDGVFYHDVIKFHCSSGACPIYVNDDFIYRDTNHIRRNFSESTRLALLDSVGFREAVNWQKYSTPQLKPAPRSLNSAIKQQDVSCCRSRLTDLILVRDALAQYFLDHGRYPKSIGFDGRYAEWGNSTENWIKDLVPTYLTTLPQDPRMTSDPKDQYFYRSNGVAYKLIAHNPPDCRQVSETHPFLIDTNRKCWAYGFWTKEAASW